MKKAFRKAALTNNTMSVMLCAGANFVTKNSCLVLHLLTFDISEPYPPKDIEHNFSHVISH